LARPSLRGTRPKEKSFRLGTKIWHFTLGCIETILALNKGPTLPGTIKDPINVSNSSSANPDGSWF